MSILKSLINNSTDFKIGYQCAIDDLKAIFENAKIFDPTMDIIGLVDNWEKIVSMAQRKLSKEKDN